MTCMAGMTLDHTCYCYRFLTLTDTHGHRPTERGRERHTHTHEHTLSSWNLQMEYLDKNYSFLGGVCRGDIENAGLASAHYLSDGYPKKVLNDLLCSADLAASHVPRCRV